MVQKRKQTIIEVSFIAFFIGMNIISIGSVSAEQQEIILLNEGFESGIPSNWENTGWVLNWYGFPHNGSNWVSNSAKGSYMITNSLNFGENTELRFWYAAESTDHPMSLDVQVDDTLVSSDVNFTHRDYKEIIVDLSNFTGDHTIRFICQTTNSFAVENIDDILITTYKDVQGDPPSDDDTNENGGSNGSPPEENQPPKANASKGAQHQGITRETIEFDATWSSDSDGEIVKYEWDFGDNTSKTGTIVYHSFQNPGMYTITLAVTDDDGGKDTDSFEIEIIEGNNPPSTPELKASEEPILKNVNYTFHVRSSDADNHTISFVFNWGDGTTTTTDYYQSNVKINVTHQWKEQGIYIIKVNAKDAQSAISETKQEIVFIDVFKEFIDGEVIGYFIDYAKSGNFTHFYNIETGEETSVKQVDKMTYLIDVDGDDQWDYEYNEKKGLVPYSSSKGIDSGDETDTKTDIPGFGIICFTIAITIYVIYWKRIK